MEIILEKGTDLNITWHEFISANHFHNPKTVNKLSDYMMGQQIKTLAHVMRTDKQDKMRQMTLNDDMDMPGSESL